MAFSIVVGVFVFCCAVASANVTLSTGVGSQEVNETNPTVHDAMHHHVSADNDTDDGIAAGATDEPENATQPPLTTRGVTLPSGFSSTHPPLVHGQANMDNKEASVTSSLPMPPNSMPKETTRSSPTTTPTTTTPSSPSSHPPLVHATMEPTAAKSEIPKSQQGHNGVKVVARVARN